MDSTKVSVNNDLEVRLIENLLVSEINPEIIRNRVGVDTVPTGPNVANLISLLVNYALIKDLDYIAKIGSMPNFVQVSQDEFFHRLAYHHPKLTLSEAGIHKHLYFREDQFFDKIINDTGEYIRVSNNNSIKTTFNLCLNSEIQKNKYNAYYSYLRDSYYFQVYSRKNPIQVINIYPGDWCTTAEYYFDWLNQEIIFVYRKDPQSCTREDKLLQIVCSYPKLHIYSISVQEVERIKERLT